LLETTNPPNTSNAYTGTRLGSGLLNVPGSARENSSCYYVNLATAGSGGVARNYICVVRESTFVFQSSSAFSYKTDNFSAQYTFEAEIPLA
jgi:hypothetical protein